MSHRPEVLTRRLEAVLGDIDAAIEACDCPEEQSHHEARYAIRRQMSRLQNLSVEV